MFRLLSRTNKPLPARAVVKPPPTREEVERTWAHLTWFREIEDVPADELDLVIERCLKGPAVPSECVPYLKTMHAEVSQRLPRAVGNTAMYDLMCLGVIEFLVRNAAPAATEHER